MEKNYANTPEIYRSVSQVRPSRHIRSTSPRLIVVTLAGMPLRAPCSGRPLLPGEVPGSGLLEFLCEQVSCVPNDVGRYAARAPTLREHRAEIEVSLGLRAFERTDGRAMLALGIEIATSTDRGEPIVAAMVDRLRLTRIVVPAASTLERIALGRQRIDLCLGGGLSPRCGLDHLRPDQSQRRRGEPHPRRRRPRHPAGRAGDRQLHRGARRHVDHVGRGQRHLMTNGWYNGPDARLSRAHSPANH